jgi:hypothetical protein
MNHAERGIYPLDVVAPEHEAIDDDLNGWGRWSRERRKRLKVGSAERNCQSRVRDHHYPTYEEMMPSILNPRHLEIDRAVLKVPYEHQRCLKMHYVDMRIAWIICRQLRIRPGDFGHWMRDARCMVLNILRREGLDTRPVGAQDMRTI